MWEAHTLSLQEQELRSPTDEWCSAAVVMATTEQKEGEEKGGYWGRKENGIKKKRREGGRERIIKGTQFCHSWTELWGHVRSQVVKKRAEVLFHRTRILINVLHFPPGLRHPRLSLFYPWNCICTAAAMFYSYLAVQTHGAESLLLPS